MTPNTQQSPQPKPLVHSNAVAPNPFASSPDMYSAATNAAGSADTSNVAPYTAMASNNHAISPMGNIPMPNGGSGTGSSANYSANPGVNGSTITQHELSSGQFDQTPAQLFGPTAALYGVQSGGYLGGVTPGSGTASSANAPASPFAANTQTNTQTNTNTSLPASPFASNTNPASAPANRPSGAVNTSTSGTGAYAGSTIAGGIAPPPAIPYGSIQNTLDTSKVPGLVGGDALSLQMQAAQAAAYKQATAYLDPQWANAERDLQTQLANQGIPVGSDAYNRAVAEFQRNKAFAYSQAQQAAVQQGNAAQAQLFGEGLASNQNAFGQALSGGNFSNAAQDQITRQILASLGFNEGVAQNNFTNSLATRNQDINELLLQQQNPLQMYQALTQGNGVTTPNFTNTPGANVNGTDIAGIIAQALGQQNNVYNAQVGAQNSNTAAYATIIAALLSDRRFKRNVRMIGMHEVGVPLYAFDYVWGTPGIGVMADEVRQVKPSAVIELPNGMLAVNYAEFSEVA